MTHPNESQTSPDLNATPSWFEARPIPVFIILAWCILQFAGIVMFLLEHWPQLIELVRTGVTSPLAFAGMLLYPFILLMAGLFLLFMRKIAIPAFGLYLVWGLAKIMTPNIDFRSGYLSLALIFGILIYCLRLKQLGLLK